MKPKINGNKEKIIEYIRKHGSITNAEAVHKLGIYRLSARIFEMKKDVHFTKHMEYGTKSDGTSTHWMVYSIKEEK